LLDPGDFLGPMLLRKPCNMTIRELLDPVSRLPHPILNGDGKTWASPVIIEYIPVRAFFSGESGVIVDESCLQEFELFPLGVVLS
jgi:hypothetical protein